jgi:HD-like signal output (HDOD) protein
VSNSDLAGVICNVLRQREKKMLQMIVRSSKALSEKSLNELPLHPQKVEQLHKMAQQAQFILEQVLLFQDISLTEISSLLETDFA